MNESLSRVLKEYADETSRGGVSPRVEAVLRKAVRGRRPAPSPWWFAVAASAVIAAMAAGYWFGGRPGGDVVRRTSPAPPAPAAPAPQPAGEVALVRAPAPVALEARPMPPAPAPRRPSPPRWSDIRTAEPRPLTPWYYHTGLPAPRAMQLVRFQVSPRDAASFGVITGQPVQAEVYIAEDGLTRAIRLVR